MLYTIYSACVERSTSESPDNSYIYCMQVTSNVSTAQSSSTSINCVSQLPPYNYSVKILNPKKLVFEVVQIKEKQKFVYW